MIRVLIKFGTRYIPRHLLQLFAHRIFQLIYFFYRGNRYEDPIDGRKYRKLLPFGRIRSRRNALAPWSLSLERHRLIWLYLKNETEIFQNHCKFLHIAPEYCFIKAFRKFTNIEYITADLNSPWADIQFDVQKIPFDDNVFDIVMCNHVLEHVDDDYIAMKEIYRILKPGGWAILQVPIDNKLETTYEDRNITRPAEREKHFGQSDHLRMYGRDYGKRLSNAGFNVVADDFINRIDPALIKKYALPEGEIIYRCIKPFRV